MKLLCVNCDEPMMFVASEGPTEGFLALTFSCPRCTARIALLTNPGETQLVRSLGVHIGGRQGAPPPLELVRASLASELTPHSIGSEEPASGAEVPVWTDEALKRLERVPPMIRGMVRKAVERFARLQDYPQITWEVVEQAEKAWG